MGPTKQALFRKAMKSKVFEVTTGDLAEVSNAMKAYEIGTLVEEPKYQCIWRATTLISGVHGSDSSPTRDEIIIQVAEYFKLLEMEFYKTEKVVYEDMLVSLMNDEQACIQKMQAYFQSDGAQTCPRGTSDYCVYEDCGLTEEPQTQDAEEIEGHMRDVGEKGANIFHKMGAAIMSFFCTIFAYLFHGESISEAASSWSDEPGPEKHAGVETKFQSDMRSRSAALETIPILRASFLGIPPRSSTVDGFVLHGNIPRVSRYRPPSEVFRKPAQTEPLIESQLLQLLELQRSKFFDENGDVSIAERKRRWNQKAPSRMSDLQSLVAIS